MASVQSSPVLRADLNGLDKLLEDFVPAAGVLGLFDQATALLRAGGLGLVTVASLTSVPVALGCFWFVRFNCTTDASWTTRTGYALTLAALLWIRHLGQGASLWALTQVARGKTVTPSRCFAAVLSELPSILFTGSVRWLMVAGAGLFGLIPGAWLAGRWLPTLSVQIEERLRYQASLRRAMELTAASAARYWAAMILLIGMLLAGTVGVAIFLNVTFYLCRVFLGLEAGYSQAVLVPTRAITVTAFMLIAWVMLEPFRACLSYVVYLDSVARFEGADLAGKLAAVMED